MRRRVDRAAVAETRESAKWERVDAMRMEASLVGNDVPEGAFHVYEYAARYHVLLKTAEYQLGRLVAAGKLKTGKALRISPKGRRCLMRVYWPANS
jgi:hypothetical protein